MLLNRCQLFSDWESFHASAQTVFNYYYNYGYDRERPEGVGCTSSSSCWTKMQKVCLPNTTCFSCHYTIIVGFSIFYNYTWSYCEVILHSYNPQCQNIDPQTKQRTLFLFYVFPNLAEPKACLTLNFSCCYVTNSSSASELFGVPMQQWMQNLIYNGFTFDLLRHWCRFHAVAVVQLIFMPSLIFAHGEHAQRYTSLFASSIPAETTPIQNTLKRKYI